MKKAVVLGSSGFVGTHLIRRLKRDGYWVRGADIKLPEFTGIECDEFMQVDLRDKLSVAIVLNNITHCFQLAADFGGAEFIFSGEHDADVMHNSAQINLNVADICKLYKPKVFFSSSACMFNHQSQQDPNNSGLKEFVHDYPAYPDSEYGWEKLFSERLHMAYGRNYKLYVRIARFHNIMGELSDFRTIRAKAPASLCRKICEAKDGTYIEVLGDGKQTRSFLHVDECVEGVMRLMDCEECLDPINIGSDEMVSINQLAQMIINISGKKLSIKNIPTNVQGVRGRNSDNTYIQEKLNWRPSEKLFDGLKKLYAFVNEQINGNN